MVKGRRIYDEAVREAVILTWEASDRICGKRLKAALPHLVESLQRHGHLDLEPEVRKRSLAVNAATSDRLLKPVMATVAGRSKRRRNPRPVGTFQCGPSPIGMRRHWATWKLTWWSTTAAPCGAP